MGYEWLLIDADGTLFDYDRAEADALARALADAEVEFLPEHLATYREINARLWASFERDEISRDYLRYARFGELSERFGLGLDPPTFSVQYLARLAEGTALIGGAEELVRRLHGRVHMALLTNGFAEVQRPRIAASGIGSLFDAVIISGEVGAAKPSARIFNTAFDRMGHPDKSHVLIVGDSLHADIRGGIEYGIDTCWFNPGGEPNRSAWSPRYEIRSLLDVLSIVDRESESPS